jgi:D-3-phosphoglycerate dehydrogenase
MKALFLDCNQQLGPVFARVHTADDPQIAVNYEPYERADVPKILAGFAICLDDHSYLPTEIVAQCPDLKHVVFLGTGARSYMDVGALEQRGIAVHIIKGYGDTAVAEHTIALMWAAARDIARMDRDIRAGTWLTREGPQLLGKTLGVVGLGGIGREVARIAAGCGMQVLAWNRTPLKDSPVPRVGIDELLGRSDVVSLNLVLNDETRHFLGAERITRMKPGAILVNTARGALVDEAALIAALQSGHVRHAALDVFQTEPLPADHPFTRLANVTLSAHSAFRTPEASETLLRRAIDIVASIVANSQNIP